MGGNRSDAESSGGVPPQIGPVDCRDDVSEGGGSTVVVPHGGSCDGRREGITNKGIHPETSGRHSSTSGLPANL